MHTGGGPCLRGVVHLVGDALGAPVAPKQVVVRDTPSSGACPGMGGRGYGRNCLPSLGRKWRGE